MKYGSQNSNFRHGGYSQVDTCPEVKQALAKDLLRRILTTKCDSKGDLPFTAEEQRWAVDIARAWMEGERPLWARDVMTSIGYEP